MNASATDIFPHRRWNPYRLPISIGLALFLLSLAFHLTGLLIASSKRIFDSHKEEMPRELIAVDLRQVPTLDTLQETAKEAPKKAKFQSSRNLQADEDTSPADAPTSWAQARGSSKAKKIVGKESAKPKESENVFSLSQADLIKRGEIQKESLVGTDSQMDSTGFFERLKKGEQLKIAALESDYGQFVIRMKKKIVQQWNPRRVVNAKMYSLEQIRVDLGVILNPLGEVIDIRILTGSAFPEYDAEAVRAIRDASPYPNPHKSLIQADGMIYMPWTFTLFMRGYGWSQVE